MLCFYIAATYLAQFIKQISLQYLINNNIEREQNFFAVQLNCNKEVSCTIFKIFVFFGSTEMW